MSPDHVAPELHPSPLPDTVYPSGLLSLQIKCLAQVRINTQEGIKIATPLETQKAES